MMLGICNVGRVKSWYRYPDVWWWLLIGIAENDDGTESRIIILKLPVWGYSIVLHMDAIAWGQRTLYYDGRRGFSIGWYFIREAVRNAIPTRSI